MMWSEMVVASFEVGLLSQCLEEQRKTTTDLSEDGRCHDQDSSQTPPEIKSEALPIQPTCSVAGMLLWDQLVS
jgi:hypothetical protein